MLLVGMLLIFYHDPGVKGTGAVAEAARRDAEDVAYGPTFAVGNRLTAAHGSWRYTGRELRQDTAPLMLRESERASPTSD
jgi:hypothetical protein